MFMVLHSVAFGMDTIMSFYTALGCSSTYGKLDTVSMSDVCNVTEPAQKENALDSFVDTISNREGSLSYVHFLCASIVRAAQDGKVPWVK